MDELEVKLTRISFTFLRRERRMGILWSVSLTLFILFVSSQEVQSRRIDTLAQSFVIQAQPDSSSSSSSFFRRNLRLQKKGNSNQQDYYLHEGRTNDADDDQAHNRYSYFHNDEDDDQPLLLTRPSSFHQQFQPNRRSSNSNPSSASSSTFAKSKFTTALLTRSNKNKVSYPSPTPSTSSSYKAKQQVGINRKHASMGFTIGGVDDSAEENNFHGHHHYDDEEDPHLHQERFKSSQYFNTKDDAAAADVDEDRVAGLNEPDANNAPLDDDEASSELGRYSLVNSYFDNEYSLKKLHEMECVTPTKSKGYCSTFRACVPSLFTPTGELEAPALAELISFSIGYCTMNSNIAENSNILMKRAGHRFAEVANRIICCPGAPPASGGEPSAEESAEKFNDFLANKGPQVGSFDEGDDEKAGADNPSVVTSGESVIWSSKEKKPTPIKTVQTSVKVTTEQPSSSGEEEINEPNDTAEDNKISFAPASTVQDEPVSSDPSSSNDDGDGSSHSIYTDDNKVANQNETDSPSSSSQEIPALPIVEGQLDASSEVSLPAEIPIEAFRPPGSNHDSLFFPIIPSDSDETGGSSISHSPVVSTPQEVVEESQQKTAQSDPTDDDEDESSFSTQQPIETSTVISTISSTSSYTSAASRKNSSFIQIQPDPVLGANGKFTLENGVYIEKATSATPRPKPNPAHQATIGETTVNIIKTEIPSLDSISKLPTKPYSSKIPSNSKNNLNANSHQHSQLITEDNIKDNNEANDFPVELETTTSSSSSEAAATATTHREPDMWDESNVDAIRDESELQSTVTSSASESETKKPVGDSSSSDSFDGINDHPESTVAPATVQDESSQETYLPSTTKLYTENDGESFQEGTTTNKSPSETEASTSNYLSPDVLTDSQDNSLNDEAQTTTSKILSSSEESSTGSYDVNNPTTSAYEIQFNDQLIQTTIPAGHYFQDEVERTTTSRPATTVSSSGSLLTMQTSLFDNSADDHEHFSDENGSGESFNPTTTFVPAVPGQNDGSLSTTTEISELQKDAPAENEELKNQLFLGTPEPGNQFPSTNQPFLDERSSDKTNPISGIPTTQVPSKGSEETAMESEDNSSNPKAPNKWSIAQVHIQSEVGNKYIHTGSSISDPEAGLDSSGESGESNELQQGGIVNEDDSHKAPSGNGNNGSFEDSHEGSSEEEKKGSSSSIEDTLTDQNAGQVQQDNSLEAESGGESIVQQDATTTSSAADLLPTTLVPSSESIRTTTPEEDLPIAPIEDEVVSTTVPPPPSSSSPLPQATQRPPTAAPETGGINYKPPQDSSGESPVPVGSQPQYQILNSCATQDYYRSLETDSTKQYPFLATIVGGSRPFCSGSLITDRHILTAAHFLSNITVSDVFHMRVHIGYRSTSPGQETQGPFVVRKVLKVIRHKSFSFEKLVNDVAILILDRPVRFTEDVHPVCLSHSTSLYAAGDIEAFETGWVEDPLIKKISPHHPYIDEHIIKYFTFGYKNITWSLHEATTRVKSNEECAANYAFLEKSGIVIRDSMVCAAPTESKEVCSFKGNSGAPLFLSNDGKPVQIGLVSWGIGCGHFPAVFTSVSSFIPWIEKVVARTS